MKPIFLIAFILVGVIACNNNSMTKTERDGEPNIYSTPDDDEEMNKAIATAKSTLYQFDEALKNNKYDTNTFALKLRFPTETGAEHIWATSITISDGHYFGIVDNLPESTTNVKFGDRIQLEKENITDWMYGDNGILRGGYTIKQIRSRMTKQEQKDFDADFQLKVED